MWFGTSEPDDSKGALPYDTYIIEEMRCDSNKGFELIPPFEIVVSRNNLVIDLGTLTDAYEKEISIHTTATSKDGEKVTFYPPTIKYREVDNTIHLSLLARCTRSLQWTCKMCIRDSYYISSTTSRSRSPDGVATYHS